MALFHEKEKRKKKLKELIKRLHRGEDLKNLKEELRRTLGEVSPEEVVAVEQQLIEEGVSPQTIRQLCDLHLSLMQEGLHKQGGDLERGHPLRILMEEHRFLLELAQDLLKLISSPFSTNIRSRLMEISSLLKSSASHYLREENVLFPYLEKHGITQPPAIMWMEHDRIRQVEKQVLHFIDQWLRTSSKPQGLQPLARQLAELLSQHFFKENRILFPMAENFFNRQEWVEVRRGFDEIGYFAFQPEPFEIEAKEERKPEIAGEIHLPTGSFSLEELEALFKALPVDITFVDRNDRVKFFSAKPDRIFIRTKAVLGRKVQQCHPQKSLHLVNRILKEFREGSRSSADFWIQKDGRLIYIRYFPLKNEKGEYLGCIEVTQDVTEIKKLEGEKRLL